MKYTLIALLLATCGQSPSIAAPLAGEIRGGALTVRIAADGRIATATLGKQRLARPIAAETALAGCHEEGPPAVRSIDRGIEVTRHLVHDAGKERCTLVERFLSTKDSVRWEIEIVGAGAPWTTDIITRLLPSPASRLREDGRGAGGEGSATKSSLKPTDIVFWTAWSDPEQLGGPWRDPLVLQPFADRAWTYDGGPNEANLVAVPIATIAEPTDDAGVSLVLSPEDTLLDMRLATNIRGEVDWTRSRYRIAAGKPLHFAMDLVAHEADWRGGLAWMVERYPDFFNPPNPEADWMAGCGAYSADERQFNTVDLRRMSFRVNWKCSEDFPYMGMFLPPLTDDRATWVRGTDEPPIAGKSALNSFHSLNEYSRWMREQHFYVLSYFNVTEFGRNMRWPAPPRTAATAADLWKDPNDFLYATHVDALLLAGGRPQGTCYNAFAVDVGDPGYQKFMLEQAQRHIDRLPASSGICIDRLDWLRQYNSRGDDGVSWVNGKPARSLYLSWRDFMAKLGPMMHSAGKVIYVNTLTKRLELLRQVDGIYDEFGQAPTALNASALMGLRKPLMCWTPGPNDLRPDPDAFFQRHLHMGAYPTAPYPGNNHCIQPNAWAAQYYLDYGPLLDALRGKKWVLRPHAVEVAGQKAKANLFEVPGGFVVPVTFGGKETSVKVALNGLPLFPGQKDFRMEVIRPGAGSTGFSPQAARVVRFSSIPPEGGTSTEINDDYCFLDVPLSRGCAMVKLSYVWIDPKASWFYSKTNVEMGTTIEGGEIHYTLDGAQPTAASPRYTIPLTIDKTTDVRAAVFAGGRQVGQTIAAEYVRLPPPAPLISPRDRLFDEAAEVTLAVPEKIPGGSQIRYTLDGTAPTRDSTLYVVPIRLTKTTRLQAATFLPGIQSYAASATFVRRPPQPQIPLGQLTPLKATVGWNGPPKTDKSIQGKPLSIAGSVYAHGIGTHAHSEIEYALKPEFHRFVAVVGVDDEMLNYPEGSVVFEVWIDGRRMAQTAVMRPGEVACVDVNIPAGGKVIRLVAGDAGDGIDADHADWANAGFVR